MNCSEEMTRICRVCLTCNVRMYNIKEKQLQVPYENLTIELDKDNDVCVKICYICYAQFQRVRKFSELVKQSSKRLSFFVDNRVKVSQETIEYYNLDTKHNLLITTIPPISIDSYSNIDSFHSNVKEEYIEIEDNTPIEHGEILKECSIKSPQGDLLLDHTFNPIQSAKLAETLTGIGRKLVECALDVSHNKPKRFKIERIKINNPQFTTTVVSQLITKKRCTSNVKKRKEVDKPVSSTLTVEGNFNEKEQTNSKSLKRIKTLMPVTINKHKIGEDKIDNSKVHDNQREAKINETKRKLTALVGSKQFPKCNRSRALLNKLNKLVGSEQAGAIAERIFPLISKGFPGVSTMPTLEIAGCKKAKVQNKHQNDVFVSDLPISVDPHNISKIPPSLSQLIKPIPLPAQINIPISVGEMSPLPHVVNSFSLSSVIDKSKDRKHLVPVNCVRKLRNKTVPSIIKKKQVTTDKPLPLSSVQSAVAALNEMVNKDEGQSHSVISTQNQKFNQNSGKEKKSVDMNKPTNKVSSFTNPKESNKIKYKRIAPKQSQQKREKPTTMDIQSSLLKIKSPVLKKTVNKEQAMLNKFTKLKEKLGQDHLTFMHDQQQKKVETFQHDTCIQSTEKEFAIHSKTDEDSSSDVEVIENDRSAH